VAKVIENSQRDINIAFVNELAKIFKLMNIDTNQVRLQQQNGIFYRLSRA
jgi:UDP-N-acetyl-D-mannosaminuronate dehydrogenase